MDENLVMGTLLNMESLMGSMEEHLRNLNGKVANNVTRIYNLEKDSLKNKIRWARVGGIFLVISTIISLILKFLI